VEDDLRFKTSAEKVKAIKMGNTKAEENSESSGWVSFYPKISDEFASAIRLKTIFNRWEKLYPASFAASK
jgi:hypothetical protein